MFKIVNMYKSLYLVFLPMSVELPSNIEVFDVELERYDVVCGSFVNARFVIRLDRPIPQGYWAVTDIKTYIDLGGGRWEMVHGVVKTLVPRELTDRIYIPECNRFVTIPIETVIKSTVDIYICRLGEPCGAMSYYMRLHKEVTKGIRVVPEFATKTVTVSLEKTRFIKGESGVVRVVVT